MRKKYGVVSWIVATAMIVSALQTPQRTSARKLEMENCGVFKVMPIGSTFQLKVSGKASGVTYTSGKEKVVSVSRDGLLRAEKKGTAIIRVQRGGRKARLKIQVKPPTGYTISKTAGTYAGSVKTQITAKKGYTVYYTTGKKFKQGNAIRAGRSRTFIFHRTNTLKIYALSSSTRMTTVNLNKTERFSQSRGDYLYRIVKESEVTPSVEPVVTAGPTGPQETVIPQETAVPTTGAAVVQTTEPQLPVGSDAGAASGGAVRMISEGLSMKECGKSVFRMTCDGGKAIIYKRKK